MTADDHDTFNRRNSDVIRQMGVDSSLKQATRHWFDVASQFEYSYHFEALGRPVIQFPQDLVALNEIIWTVRPDLVIETGIARGGSLINTASQLALLDVCEAAEGTGELSVGKSRRRVVGIDIDIRDHNREAIQRHPLAPWIRMLQGSSIEDGIVEEISGLASEHSCVLVLLDSNHTHDHVLAELEAYAPLVTPGSYCVVYDTVIELMPPDAFPDRPWGVGNNPMTAVREYLRSHPEFRIDTSIADKLQITVAPDGYLLRDRSPSPSST